MALLQPKFHSGSSAVLAANPSFVVFGDLVWSQEEVPFSQTDRVNESARFFLPSEQIVFAYFSKK